MNTKRSRLPLLAAAAALGFCLTVQAADPILVVGHSNPDTDSICSAIAVAQLKSLQGVPAQAIAQGQPNPETRYVLETFKLAAPPVVNSVAGRQVFLVDHTDYPQAPADIKKADVVGFADHHKLGGLATDKPVEAWGAPVGATGTVVTRMYDVAGVAIPKDIAGCLLATIVSDTVMFKSATTTAQDKAAAERLAKLAGVADINALGLKVLEAKADIKGQSPAALLQRDLKTFEMSGKKVAVAQLELLSLAAVAPIKPELLGAMKDLKRDGYHSVFLMLTDTTQEATDLLFLSDDPAIVQTTWKVKPEGSSAWLPGVMSRKKQVIPPLEKTLK